MKQEALEKHLLSLSGAYECYPFGPAPRVFKVMNKMFALTNVDRFEGINLKCDPERALELRAEFAAITAGYHMSKKHWNTVGVDAGVSDALIYELIDHSYELVVQSLPKKLQKELDSMSTND